MILEELCVVRELAERMAKLGWPQEESLFVWGKNTKLTVNKDKWFLTEYRNHCLIWFAAPTMPEIMKKLPWQTRYFFCGCFHQIVGFEGGESDEQSAANAAGKYWCWWKEKEVIYDKS